MVAEITFESALMYLKIIRKHSTHAIISNKQHMRFLIIEWNIIAMTLPCS